MPGLAAFNLQQWIDTHADRLKLPVGNGQIRHAGTGWATSMNGEQEIGSLVRAANFLTCPDKSPILGGNEARWPGLDAPVAA